VRSKTAWLLIVHYQVLRVNDRPAQLSGTAFNVAVQVEHAIRRAAG